MPQLKLVFGETRMFTRFQRYIDNVGLHWFLANLVLLGYLMYVHISIAMSSAGGAILEVVIVLPIALIGLVGPRLILGFLVARPNGSLRVARLCSYVIFVWIALQIFAKGDAAAVCLPADYARGVLVVWDHILGDLRPQNADRPGSSAAVQTL